LNLPARQRIRNVWFIGYVMIGVFPTSSYSFLLDDTQTRFDNPDRREFEDDELDARFLRGGIPDLGSAPLASWFVARLAAMTGGKLGLLNGGEQHVDGGDCCLHVLVFRADQKHVGTLQVQA